jgi:hypothetical protein
MLDLHDVEVSIAGRPAHALKQLIGDPRQRGEWPSTPHVTRRPASDGDSPLIDHDRREHLTVFVQRSVRGLALSRPQHCQNTDLVALGDAED